ncbi:MAG: fibronectin type III domain-containing protein [Microbacteriaceae bacterium]
MRRTARTALVALATSALLLSAVPAISASADAAEPTIIDIPSSTITGLAIDGDRLYLKDDVSGRPAVYRSELSFDTASATDAVYIAHGETIAAAEGQVAWMAPGGDEVRGRDEHDTALISYESNARPSHVSQGWFLSRGTALASFATGFDSYTGYESALLDGVLYRPGSSWTTSRADVATRDLSTGATSFVRSPEGCAGVSKVQAAGSWLLLLCGTSHWIVDRTGGVAPFSFEASGDSVRLGNGFVTILSGQTLTWSSLSGGALTPQTLSSTAIASAASTGAQPTVAWADEAGAAHAALLPVTVSALPIHPVGPSSAPPVPSVSTSVTSNSITVNWPAPSSSDEVVGYVVTLVGRTEFPKDRSIRVVLPAGVLSHTFTNLNAGWAYGIQIVAENSVGLSTIGRFAATPLYAFPQIVTVSAASYVEDTGIATVTWSYTPNFQHELARSFDVSLNGHSISGLSAATRSASFLAPGSVRGDTVTVTAHGAGQSGLSWRALETDEDSELPTASIASLAPVTLGKTWAATVAASDNRAVVSIDLRVRSSAGPSKALGDWTYPVGWQAISDTYSVTSAAKPGATYCLSTRARDAKNNVSEWSPQACTAIALDDAVLKKAGRWQKYSSPSYFNGSSLRVRSSTAYLSTAVRSSDIYIVATTCPTCGKVGVKYGSSNTWMVDLRSTVKKHRQIIKVQGPATYTGTVKIVRWGSNPALVDGIAVVGR